MSVDAQQLASELAQDPAQLGYAALVASGHDAGLAALLNARSGPGAAVVVEPVLSKGDFVLAILPGVMRIDGLADAATKSKWQRLWEAIQASESFRVADPRVALLLDMAVADGVLTAPERAAVGQRAGSRAEALWGAGARVGPDDISRALRGA